MDAHTEVVMAACGIKSGQSSGGKSNVSSGSFGCEALSSSVSQEPARLMRNRLDDRVTFIIVSSPSPCHPALDLVQRVIQSIATYIDGLVCPSIMIVLDGYTVADMDRTKKGRVTPSLASNYEEYCVRLQSLTNEEYADMNILDLPVHRFRPQFEVVRLPTHTGFALAVKEALQRCQTSHAMIIQQDRAFCNRMDFMQDLICRMDSPDCDHVRYVGFPSSSSCTHASLLQKRYGLGCLVDDTARIPVSPIERTDIANTKPQIYLQPLIFWYDSNHLCNVTKYLQIYYPYKNTPAVMKRRLGIPAIREMILKNGDFIEDRFGQFQRNYLLWLKDQGTAYNSADILEAFKWFGSYLYWTECDPISCTDEDDSDSDSDGGVRDDMADATDMTALTIAQLLPNLAAELPNAVCYVKHLRGRNYNPAYAAERQLVARNNRLQKQSEAQTPGQGTDESILQVPSSL
jgi:hypothetical protein